MNERVCIRDPVVVSKIFDFSSQILNKFSGWSDIDELSLSVLEKDPQGVFEFLCIDNYTQELDI